MTTPLRHVLLVGFMGSGKSSVGRLLANRLGAPFIDLDDRIAAEAGRAIPEIFQDDGEEAFRDRETASLRTLAEEPPSIVACGGGAVLRPENRGLLRELGTVVYLQVDAEEAVRRCPTGTGRPLLANRSPEDVARLLESREPLYAEVADLVVTTMGLSAAAVAEHIQRLLGGSSQTVPEDHPTAAEKECE